MSDTAKQAAVLNRYSDNGRDYPDHEEMAWRIVELEAEIDRLRDENAALTAAVERVRALHTPIPSHVALIDVFGCSECSDDGRYSHYPCATLRALEVGRE